MDGTDVTLQDGVEKKDFGFNTNSQWVKFTRGCFSIVFNFIPIKYSSLPVCDFSKSVLCSSLYC